MQPPTPRRQRCAGGSGCRSKTYKKLTSSPLGFLAFTVKERAAVLRHRLLAALTSFDNHFRNRVGELVQHPLHIGDRSDPLTIHSDDVFPDFQVNVEAVSTQNVK